MQLDASSLIPELSQCQGSCLERLESALNGNGKVQRAHIKHEQGLPQVCLHYDPARVSAEQAQRIAARTGSKIANRYRHEVYPVEAWTARIAPWCSSMVWGVWRAYSAPG